jgi:hypothetical protein
MNVFTLEEIHCDTMTTLTFVYLEIRIFKNRLMCKDVNLIVRIGFLEFEL